MVLPPTGMGLQKRLMDILTTIGAIQLTDVLLAQQPGLPQVSYEAVALDSEVQLV